MIAKTFIVEDARTTVAPITEGICQQTLRLLVLGGVIIGKDILVIGAVRPPGRIGGVAGVTRRTTYDRDVGGGDFFSLYTVSRGL